MPRDTSTPEILHNTIPFSSAEEAWFWFIDANEARHHGAKIVAGMATFPRPCEPIDIIKIVDRLYRQRRLLADHLRILAHYGLRRQPPEPRRPSEQKALVLWLEAMVCLDGTMRLKGIVA